MSIGVAQAAVNLVVAVTVGAAIEFGRQWRNRLAGLRTNTLVALGENAMLLPQSSGNMGRAASISTAKIA